MKNNHKVFFAGILALALIFGLMLTGCGGDGTDTGGPGQVAIPPPAIDSLPALPVVGGISAVTSESEALTLLAAIKASSVWTINDTVEDLVEEKSTSFPDGYRWDFTDNTDMGYAISSKGNYSKTGSAMVGREVTTSDTTIEFTSNKTFGSSPVVTFYLGSTIREIQNTDYSWNSRGDWGYEGGGSAYGLTVSASGKSARIIFSNQWYAWENESGDEGLTISGFLKVYGTSNTPVLTRTFDNGEDAIAVQALFN
ncbi:hypothetical protein [Leadbettera azotonutricia]|uniref:Putative lipoprotein n=1 Tax=Leadbettera azotonutricia (strain ATCC BAA-888 / DSM 13862 / ZAS-9) TaxID=545695 RepID=F5Y703_LEAAZ|nr:hypothetical protein [Leadbettera azotonutricia]AEF81032.1 putative lipoprotein [Leadbettera azotonutricia ZAS-9]